MGFTGKCRKTLFDRRQNNSFNRLGQNYFKIIFTRLGAYTSVEPFFENVVLNDDFL